MKFTANKEQIINELQSLAAVADKKQTLPILSNILVKCEGSTVKFQSTTESTIYIFLFSNTFLNIFLLLQMNKFLNNIFYSGKIYQTLYCIERKS